MFANPETDGSLSSKFLTPVKFCAPLQCSPDCEARNLGQWRYEKRVAVWRPC